MHEIGNFLGYRDVSINLPPAVLMTENLATGTRRLPNSVVIVPAEAVPPPVVESTAEPAIEPTAEPPMAATSIESSPVVATESTATASETPVEVATPSQPIAIEQITETMPLSVSDSVSEPHNASTSTSNATSPITALPPSVEAVIPTPQNAIVVPELLAISAVEPQSATLETSLPVGITLSDEIAAPRTLSDLLPPIMILPLVSAPVIGSSGLFDRLLSTVLEHGSQSEIPVAGSRVAARPEHAALAMWSTTRAPVLARADSSVIGIRQHSEPSVSGLRVSTSFAPHTIVEAAAFGTSAEKAGHSSAEKRKPSTLERVFAAWGEEQKLSTLGPQDI
jgi:hypothetical protein